MIEISSRSGRAVIESPHWDTQVLEAEGNSAAPRIFVDLDADIMDSHSEQTICTATVKFDGNRTAVVHFSVRVSDGKVRGKVTAGGKKRDVEQTVNVPVWERTHVSGKADKPLDMVAFARKAARMDGSK